MQISIPELALIVSVGPSNAGKSTFARTHFKPTEVLSSDFCRGLVSDDENDQSATNEAFDLLHYIARKRLAAGRLTVIDATNVQAESRKPLIALAREYHVLPIALVFDLPSGSARSATAHGPTATSAHTSFGASSGICAARCAGCSTSMSTTGRMLPHRF
jgi:protein phosphatase